MNEEQQLPPKTSGLAIASLILAILGMCTCVTALPGLILGIIALVQINRNPQRLKGQGLALAGTIVSAIAVMFTPILAAIIFPVFARARATAQQSSCLVNVKQLGNAMSMYTNDWNDQLPPAENWNKALTPYAGNTAIFICPSAKSKDEPSYAMNGQLSGLFDAQLEDPAYTVMIFDSIPGRNRSGGSELLPSPPRHLGENNTIGFADGHAKAVDRVESSALNWDPKAAAGDQPVY